jgi:hypothetical protein
MKKYTLLSKFIGILLLSLALSSCYLPHDFSIDIRITRNGEYALRYQGELIAVNLHKKIREQQLSEDELQKEIQVYIRDLKRDPAFSEIDYVNNGFFRVKYVYASTIQRQPYYNFLRGNNKIVTLSYHEDKQLLSIIGGKLQGSQKDIAIKENIKTQGKIRIITDLPVLKHNANQKLDTKTPSYIWNVSSISEPTPSILINMKEKT